jgi:hypothetical protein
MKKSLVSLVLFSLLLSAVVVFAGPGTPLTTDRAGNSIQGPAPNPLTTYLISSNASATVALYPSVLWFALNYNGPATCQIRLMNSATKASWVQMPVQAQTSYSRVVGPNAGFLNYSGCAGSSGQNSVLEMM